MERKQEDKPPEEPEELLREFEWVKGHDGHPENERCDKLATTAADSDILLDDDGGSLV